MVRYTLAYLRTFFGSLVDPQVRPYLVAAANLLAVGTIFYSLIEGWAPLDAAYFCVITLATIGYGDLVPVTQLGKLFTMLYVIAGLGVISAFIGAITRVSVERAQHSPRQHLFRRHGDHDSSHSPETSPVSHTNPEGSSQEEH
jgi:voltage-gated potassium channel